MKWMRYFLYLSIVLCMLLCLPACGWMDDLRSYKQGPEEAAVPEEQSPSPPESSIVEQRLGLADPPLLPEEAAATASPPEAASNASAETKEILLYYMSAEGDSLEAERREIPKETGLARATVQQLLSGPRDEDLLPVIPSGISLRSINISGGTCTVDLSAELSDLAAISPAEQELALYSLVNTLSQFDSVDYVQVLINGQKLSEFGGVDASQALAPMDL